MEGLGPGFETRAGLGVLDGLLAVRLVIQAADRVGQNRLVLGCNSFQVIPDLVVGVVPLVRGCWSSARMEPVVHRRLNWYYFHHH